MKQKIRFLFLVIFTATVIISGFAGCVPKDKFDIEKISSYKEIKDLDRGLVDSIDSIISKRQQKPFVFGQLLETEAFYLQNGEVSGFTAELCKLFTKLFGIEFQLKICDAFEDLIDVDDGIIKLKNDIDFTGDLTYSAKRVDPNDPNRFYMTSHAIAERSFRIFYLKDSFSGFSDEKQLNGLKVGYLDGSIDGNHIQEVYPKLNIYPLIPVAQSDVWNRLRDGTIDVYAVEGVIDPYFDRYDEIESQTFFPLIYNSVSLSTQNPELEPFIEVIDRYLEVGGIDVFFKLYKEGDITYAKYKLEHILKKFEAEGQISAGYLDRLKTSGNKVKIALENDNYPICFYNTKEKKYQGIAVDIIDEIFALLEIEYEVVNTLTASWNDILNMLRSGEIEMVEELLWTQQREDQGLFRWSDVPYASTNYTLISRADFEMLTNYQVMRQRVAFVSGSAYEDIYNKWFNFDETKDVPCNTQYEALEKLENGEVDLVMGSDYVLLTQTNYLEKPGFKINIRFNERVESHFGFDIDKGKDLSCIISEAQKYVKTSLIENAWMAKTFDYSKKLANQRSIFFLLTAMVVVIAAIMIVFFMYKSSRRKTAEQTAQAASLAKSNFLAHMSHEIRTPLNAIMGMANIALNSIEDREKTIYSINQAIHSSKHLLGIINDVLDMSKIESGKFELTDEPFELLKALRGITDIIKTRCSEKNIKFVDNIDTFREMTVIGDKLRLDQVLINLLGNAVKFTQNDGEIKLLLNCLSEDESFVRIKFDICDNGIGMSPEQLTKLFKPFEQTDKNIAARYGGTGLGLSISQSLINIMGGKIEAESKQGVGSKFYFDLRFKKSDAAAVEVESVCETPSLLGKRILLVEDIEINRIIIKELLEPTDVIIEEAENGLKAVEIFNNSAIGYFDLIFMDIQMPLMDGYAATKEIRLQKRADALYIPIIAMTANAYKEDVDKAITAGMNDHLSKPIDIKAVFWALNKFILKK